MTTVQDPEDRRLERVAAWFAQRSLWVGAGAVALAPVLNTLLTATDGWWRWVVTGLLAVIALAGFAVPAAKSVQAERRAEDAETAVIESAGEMRLALTDGLLPVISYVVEGCCSDDPEKRRELKAGAISLVLAAAAKVCDPGNKARACWYEMVIDTPDEIKLVPRQHFGRGAKPSTSFTSKNRRGYELINNLIRDTPELWPDLSKEKPGNWQPSATSTKYGTFLVVPVRSTRPYGMLTVDADDPGSLTDEDVAVVQMLASILALALSSAKATDQLVGPPSS
ncbi:GAF domain-containing protein [Prauserella shujinwangii]|uniref:GAF domain-containing protein n=1 Tax=Prauserella shujinwangii TaxID=1453103 RepID=A0A2T0LXE9_9PSEU|nr:GAF domain-containing protein [Prauserella shujinwangii]PRX48700.1 GAF domain-containing protein [Prauserella shujinwangii]